MLVLEFIRFTFYSPFCCAALPSPLYLISPLIKPLKLFFYERGRRLFMLFCHCFSFFIVMFYVCVFFMVWKPTGYVFDMFVRLFFHLHLFKSISFVGHKNRVIFIMDFNDIAYVAERASIERHSFDAFN